MNFIYNIFLNFNKKIYEFYDWNKEDIIIHIRKILAFKISTKNLKIIKNNVVQIDKKILDKCKNKTEDFNNNNIKYAILLSDGKELIAIKLNKNFITSGKSSLMIDEHQEIVKIINKYKETTLKIKIIKKEKPNNYRTRFETKNEKFINKQLKNIEKEKQEKKLNYICLECFGKTEPTLDKALIKIKKEIVKNNDNFHKVFKILKFVNQK